MWLLLLACAPTPAPLGVAGAPLGAAPHGAGLPHRAPPGPALDPGARDEDGDGHVAREDCDDADPAVHVGVAEVGDGRDQDCDGQVDEGLEGGTHPPPREDRIGALGYGPPHARRSLLISRPARPRSSVCRRRG